MRGSTEDFRRRTIAPVAVGDDGSAHVPKKELVTCLQVLLQGRRLRVARTLPEATTLVRELQNFQVKINRQTRQQSYGAKGTRKHDDLVLALALATFYAEMM